MSTRSTRVEQKNFYLHSKGYLNHLLRKPQSYYQPYLSLITRFVPKGKSLLDIGCGAGQTVSMLSSLGYNVFGVDLSPLFLGKGRKDATNGFAFISADAEELPFRDKYFDAVCSFEFIEHCSNPEKVLSEMIRVLKPGGYIIIRSPNLCSPFLPVRDIFRMLAGGKVRSLFYRNAYDALRFCIRTVKLSLCKLYMKSPSFLSLEPVLSEEAEGGGDLDASYQSCQIDISKFLRMRGFQVLSLTGGYKHIGHRILWKIFPHFGPAIHIAAVKRKLNDS